MDSESITWLIGGGLMNMVWQYLLMLLVALSLIAFAFVLGLGLAVWQRRRERRAEIVAKNREHFVPYVAEEHIAASMTAGLPDLGRRPGYWQPVEPVIDANVYTHNADVFMPLVPLVPACGVAHNCNGCFTCPDLNPPVLHSDV